MLLKKSRPLIKKPNSQKIIPSIFDKCIVKILAKATK